MIDTTNDRVSVYADLAGSWRWHRVDTANGRIVSMSSEGYADKAYCLEAARAYNSDVPPDRVNGR